MPNAGDSSFANVSLLLHGDGTNDSTSFADSSPNTKAVAVFGGAKISTAQSKFGGASMLFDGAGAYIECSQHPDFDLGAGDFTIEAWVRPSNVSGFGNIVTYSNGTSQNSNYAFSILRNGAAWYFNVFIGTAQYGPSSVGVATANQWTHIALSRQGSNLRSFVDGALVNDTAVGSLALNTLATPVLQTGRAQGLYPFAGHIDDMRITKGVARYISSFTPPAVAFPDSAASLGLLSGAVTGSTGSPAARVVRAFREDTGAYVGGAISDAGTGAFSITSAYSGEHTLVAYPVTGENLPALVHRGVIPI